MTPKIIGRYEVKSELGRGGMATVYHAYDPRFERDVAVKVLPAALLHDPQFRTRFEREAKMIALLEHPAIVPVYDFGEQDGQPFIVMRYMSGGSLDERIKQGPMSTEDTARIIARLAPSLDAAHAKGIIHRDLKPGNILFDQYGNAFLSDFGIARLTQQRSSTLTGGGIVGTPAYMSPEQVQGDKEIDGRSDIYALGVLIFHMLTGKRPYDGDTPAKVMMMHVLDPLPDIHQVKADLPQSLEVVITKALAKDPEQRFSSVSDLTDSLDKAVRGEALVNTASHTAAQTIVRYPETMVSQTKPPVGTAPRIKPKKRRTPLMAVGLISLLTIAVFIATGAGLVFFGRQGNGPLAMLAPTTPSPIQANISTPVPSTATSTVAPSPTVLVVLNNTNTSQPPTASATPQQSPTATITQTPQPSIPITGGADKVAYIYNGDIWVANLDGSDLIQMTEDEAEKNNLAWTPDGQTIIYISGNCVHSVDFSTGKLDIITCFNFVESLTSFEISPDGNQVAISLDKKLYIVPYDPQALAQISIRSDLSQIADCEEFAPYARNFVKQVRWSKDGTLLAAKIFVPVSGGLQGDVIHVMDISTCTDKPDALDNFPPPRFSYNEYDSYPVIQNFAWDGIYLFALTSNIRNDGFGDLYIYNMDLHKAKLAVNPIDDVCCYRDPHWSPDGNYLIFAFQDYLQGSDSITQLYYIPYGSIGTGSKYEPLPLPKITDPREKPQPVLRPTQ